MTTVDFYTINYQLIIQKREKKEKRLIKSRTILSLVLLLGFAAGFLLAQVEGENEIKNLQIKQLEDKLIVLIESEIGILYDSFVLINPNRLVLDFMNIEKTSLEAEYAVNSFGIVKIRTGKSRPSVCRIVFDIEQEFPQYRIDEVENGLEISFWPEIIDIDKKEPEIKEAEEKETRKKSEAEPIKVEKTPIKIEPIVERKTERVTKEPKEEKKFTIGIISGFYFVQDEDFKEIYGGSSFIFGGEYSFVLPIKSIKSLDFLLGFNNMQATGKTTFLEEELKLSMKHFSFAIRYIMNLKRFSPFIGPGIDYITYKETYPEDFPIDSIEGSTLGFHFQVGSYIHITDFLSTKLFFKYNIAKTTRDDIEITLGGYHVGIGLAYRFNL